MWVQLFSLVEQNEKPLDNIVKDGGYAAIFRTIACIGDSLASGEFESRSETGTLDWHDMFDYSWGQYIARMCGSKVYNFSRGGMTAKEYYNSFAEHNGFWNNSYASQAYIIALGVNDILNQSQEIGNVNDAETGADTFAFYYGKIIQKYIKIQPRAKFFFITMPASEDDSEEIRFKKEKHSLILHDFANKYQNSYVIDLFKYAPKHDKEFKKCMYMGGHLNPMGYIYTANQIASYIDYIIRSNPEKFKEVPFIGTEIYYH